MSDSPIKILLVEDNPGDARLLQLALAEAGSGRFALTHVSTLSEGLERLAEDGIDVVLLDLSLPDSQGLETFLKAHAQAPGVPFVVMTGLADERMAISALREGAQDYLVKVLYSSSRLVTLGLLSLRLLLAEELLWGKVAQGLVRTHCVIGKLPKAELLVQGSDLQGKVIDLIELLGMGTLCPFHGTIELGRARWQYEEAKVSLLTRLFKARLELGASVHLYSSYWEGHPGLQGT